MTYQSTVLADSPAYYWRLQETSGTTFADSAGTNSASIQGGVILGQSGPPCDTYSIQLNGSTGWLSTSLSITAPLAYSQEIWFKTTTTTGGFLLVFTNTQTGSNGTADDRVIYMDNSGHIYAHSWFSGEHGVNSSGVYNDGKWHHVVATSSGTDMILYIDGVQVASGSGYSTDETPSGYWRIGDLPWDSWANNPSDRYFTGYISNSAIYNKVLTATQVQNHYNAGIAIPSDNNTALTFVENSASSSPTAPPVVTIVFVDHYKISNQSGINQSDVVFQFDTDITNWTVNVVGTGPTSGIVVSSGGAVASGNTISVAIPYNDMYQQGSNQVNIYGQNSVGWTPYMES